MGKFEATRVQAQCKRCGSVCKCQEELCYQAQIKGKGVTFGLCDDCIVDDILDRIGNV